MRELKKVKVRSVMNQKKKKKGRQRWEWDRCVVDKNPRDKKKKKKKKRKKHIDVIKFGKIINKLQLRNVTTIFSQ